MATVITWGAKQLMTQAFYAAYCDEAWGVLLALLAQKRHNERRSARYPHCAKNREHSRFDL